MFQHDVRQTLRSWVYRTWVLASMLAAAGCLLFYAGKHHGAGIMQSASTLISNLLHWSVLGSVTLIIVLTAGCISVGARHHGRLGAQPGN